MYQLLAGMNDVTKVNMQARPPLGGSNPIEFMINFDDNR